MIKRLALTALCLAGILWLVSPIPVRTAMNGASRKAYLPAVRRVIPPTPTLVPLVTLKSVSAIKGEAPYSYIVGEVLVREVEGRPVGAIPLRVKWYDADGLLLDVQNDTALHTRTNPGEVNPFISMSSASNVVSVQIEILTPARGNSDNVRLPVVSSTPVNEPPTMINGVARNDTGREVDNMSVVATLYDRSGHVTEVFTGRTHQRAVGIGAVVEFQVAFADEMEFDSYNLRVQGQIVR